MARWLLAMAWLALATTAPAQEALWEIYHDAGSRAQLRGFPADAERLYRSALDAAAKAPPFMALARTHEGLAGLYIEQDRKDEAEEQVKQMLAVTEKVHGAASPTTLDCCQKVGEFYLRLDYHLERAEPYLRRVLEARAKEADVNVIAGPGLTLYTCYLFQNKLDDAEKIIRWCISIAESKPGPNQANSIAGCLHGLAVVQVKRKQDDEAMATACHALEVMEKARGANDTDILWVLYRTGDLHYQLLGRPALAEPYYRRALDITEKAGDAFKGKRGEFLLAIGDVLHAQGKHTEAVPFFERFLNVMDNLPVQSDEDKRNLSLMLLKVARFHLDLGHAAEAEGLTRRAQALMNEVAPGPGRDTGSVYRRLAECCLARNQATEAETLARRALEAHEKRFGPIHGQVAIDLSLLARIARLRNQDAEAEKCCKQAVDIGVKEISLGRPDMRAIVDEYEVLLRKQNRAEEAKQMEARAASLRLPPSTVR
jgi:tetratricopeptide (TPR) repeat protein